MQQRDIVKRCIQLLNRMQRDKRVGKATKAELAHAANELKKLATDGTSPRRMTEDIVVIVATVCRILLKIFYA